MTAEQIRRSGDPAAAIDLCRDALARFPGHLSARVTLGWALLDLGRLQEAREEFQTVRQSAPDNFAAIRGLAQLHVLEENDENDENDPSCAPDMEAGAPAPAAPAAVVTPAAARLAVAPLELVAAIASPAPEVLAPEPAPVPVVAPVAVAPSYPSPVVVRLESWLSRVTALRAAV